MIKIIKKIFNSGNARTLKAKKNVLASLFIKGVSILVGFILVPMTIEYLDTSRYGIWLTLSSFLGWFTFFEIGLGAGMRNKLAESLAKKDYKLAKAYISTTYVLLSIVIGAVALLFFFINPFLDWTKILNTEPEMLEELRALALIIFGFFFIRFVAKLIGSLLYADQRPALSNSFGPIGNVLILGVIFLLTKYAKSSLLYLGLTMSIIPVFVLIIASVYLFSTDYKKIRPSIKSVELKYAKDLLGLGVKFFIIQFSALVLFKSSNIIIIQFFGPAEVTAYNIAFKYFSMINMLFTIIITPFWSAHTEAWVKKEINWIKNTTRKLLYIWLGFLVLTILMFFASDFVYDLWIGKERMLDITIPKSLSLMLGVYFLIYTFGGVYNMFINGVGKIRLQTISLLIGAAIFVPLAILFIKVFNMGVTGVVLATIVSNMYSPIIAPMQYFKIIGGKAKGIWNK